MAPFAEKSERMEIRNVRQPTNFQRPFNTATDLPLMMSDEGLGKSIWGMESSKTPRKTECG